MPNDIQSWGELQEQFSLSPTEMGRLEAFDKVFMATQAHTNLIARSTIEDRWSRHYADSLQLAEFLPQSGEWLDVGSGAGFPGLILSAIAMERAPALRLTLCDSVKKKARFLEETALAMGVSNVSIRDVRAETLAQEKKRFSVISARAVASLDKLLALTQPLLEMGGLLIFPKGQKADEELTEAKRRWTFTCESRPSMTCSTASILILKRPEQHQ